MNFNNDDFSRFAADCGLIIHPSEIKVDNQWHNCKLVDNKTGKSGCYIVYPNGIAQVKSWREPDRVATYIPTGTSHKISSDFKKQLREQQKAQYTAYFKVSQESYKKYTAISNTDTSSEYLSRKQIKPFNAKVDDRGNIIIPFYNHKGYISTLQTIYPDGNKLFEKGGQLSGCFHKIGLSHKLCEEYKGQIYIGEGYATMASVHMAVKEPCIVAANCGNMLPVLEHLVKQYPKAEFIICADNDLRHSDKNPGLEAAKNCRLKHPCKIVYPDFTSIKNSSELSDFNDIHVNIGLEAVKAQIETQLSKQINNAKTTLSNYTYALSEYTSIPYKDELDNIRSYFEYFGTNWSDNLNSVYINDLQCEVKTVNNDIKITNLFLDYKLVCTEQTLPSAITLNIDQNLYPVFKQKLEKEKMNSVIDNDQKLQQIKSKQNQAEHEIE